MDNWIARTHRMSQESLNRQLSDAAIQGQADDVLSALECGAEIDTAINYGDTALMLASTYNHPHIVRILIEHGADIDAKNCNGVTALLWASAGGHLDSIKLLVEAGADMDAKNNGDETALSVAEERGYTEVVDFLESVIEKMQLMKTILDEANKNQNVGLSF